MSVQNEGVRAIDGKNRIKASAACLILLSIALNLTLISSFLRVTELSAESEARCVIQMYSAALACREENVKGCRIVSRDRLSSESGLPGLSLASVPPEGTGALPLRYGGVELPGSARHELRSIKIVTALHLKDGMK